MKVKFPEQFLGQLFFVCCDSKSKCLEVLEFRGGKKLKDIFPLYSPLSFET